nr:pentapeptide repeat-containing protein [Maricaulis sp.]
MRQDRSECSTMVRLILALTALLATSGLAQAQDAGQIARVQAGQSCPGCNLFQAELAYRDLPGIDLSGARLRQANLALVTMNRARFDGADLSIANLFGGRFTGASFRNADLSRANLVGAYFGSADFSGANLSGATLSGAEMAGVRGLTQTQLSSACGDAWTQLPAGLSLPACH